MRYEPEPEEYILTPEQERQVISNATKRVVEQIAWKMKKASFTNAQIEAKIKSIDWEKEIPRDEILKNANSNVHQNNWHKSQREKEKKEAAEKLELEEKNILSLKKKYTPEEMISLATKTAKEKFGTHFAVTETNRLFIAALCYFFSEDERFETELGYSFAKGLLVRGTAGVGKTFIPTCLSENEIHPVRVIDVFEINQAITDDGSYKLVFQNGKEIICIDDVGAERPVVLYGNKIQWFKEFIETSYARNKNIFRRIIVTTNFNASDFTEVYGNRVRDRMREVFNVIDITGDSMRK